MKLRIGDKVRFLNEKGEGVVSRIKDSKTVFVELPDGFEIPYLSAHLVPVNTELILNKDTDNIELTPGANMADALYFIIEPDHETPVLVSEYTLYIYNTSSYNLLFSYSIKDEEYYQTIKYGELGPYQKIILKQVKLPFFREFNKHKLDVIFFKKTHYKNQIPVSEIVYVTEKNLNNSHSIRHPEFKHPVFAWAIKENFSELDAIEHELSEEDIKRVTSIKEFTGRTKISKSKKEHLKSLEKEIDLHIEELIENTEGMTNHEMLSVQLEKFEKELDAAIAQGIKKIVFIHGVGNGRLKQEIISVLKTIKGITYQDASYKEYGLGATQVNIH